MLELNKTHHGDCMDVMQDIDSNSVDCIVTDPPYGMSFMGKDWDKAVPSIAIWQECSRVLKPGAFAFVMCIPRQDCLARMICRLEDAGFNVSFSSIYHTFASGFPKARNLSKAVDKRAGVEREIIGKDKYAGKGRVLKETSICLGKSENSYITLPHSDQAKALDGAYGGFQPKPAVEVIIVAMKPLECKTYLDQAISNEHGLTWLDDCRIPFNKDVEPRKRWEESSTYKSYDFHSARTQVLPGLRRTSPFVGDVQKGRFPANVLCEDNVMDDGHTTKSVGGECVRSEGSVFKGTEGRNHFNYGDIGSYSRYFSLDAWFAERIKQLPKEAQKTFPWLIVPKASKSEKNRGLDDISNGHATVKPIKLMSWLITLASREGDIVLDPFCGSGTTAIAAKMLGRQYICIEREEDYCEIACKRVAAIPTNLSGY